MNETLLTAFQRDVESGIRALLEERGKAVLDRAIYEGVVPFYSAEMQRYVKFMIDGLEVWLFENEANFSGPAGDGEFERADFASEAELKEAFLKGLAGHLEVCHS